MSAEATSRKRARGGGLNDILYEKAKKANADRCPKTVKKVVDRILAHFDNAVNDGLFWVCMPLESKDEPFIKEILEELRGEPYGFDAREHEKMSGTIVVELVPPPQTEVVASAE